mmetsp:Transcript_161148/g.517263  ORF Transcript_161148/g.517263 Transcript_161148/m.517263 type:complete len:254 (+) Transcript_161148:3698-4459(+)
MLCDLLLHAQLCLRLLTHLPDPLLRGSVFLRDLALALIAELGHLLAGLGLLGLELLILFDLEVLHLPSHLHALLGQVLSLHVELRCFLGHLIGGFGQLFLHLFLLDRSLLLKVPLHDHHALLHSGLFGLHLALALLSEGFYLAAQFGLLFRHLVSLLIELASLLFQQLLVGLDFFCYTPHRNLLFSAPSETFRRPSAVRTRPGSGRAPAACARTPFACPNRSAAWPLQGAARLHASPFRWWIPPPPVFCGSWR